MNIQPKLDELKALAESQKKRAEIRRQIPGRKSVQTNAPDRIADSLEASSAGLMQLIAVVGAQARALEKICPWMSAALEDKNVCEEMKADVNAMFTAMEAAAKLLGVVG